MALTGERGSDRSRPTLLLVDGHAYAYRAFHAIRSLSSPAGYPTNAIFGFIKMLAKMRAMLDPTHLAVVWDGGLSEERLAALPGYKAQRPPMPDSLKQQLDGLQAWLEAAEIASLRHEGVEADDWIGSLASRAESAGWSVIIASSDKDFMQLVSDRVGLFNPGDKTGKIWGPADVAAKTGVEPHQVVDWLSLVGDSVDNIPGAKGIGPRTAAELLTKYGSIGAMFSALSQVEPERIRQSLSDSEQILRRNQALIRLKTDLDHASGADLESMALRAGHLDQMIELCAGWGFRSLRQELERDRAEPALLP